MTELEEPMRTVLLYEEDGRTLAVKARIRCVGRLPPILGRPYDDLDSKPAMLIYQLEAGVSYREVPLRVLTDAEEQASHTGEKK